MTETTYTRDGSTKLELVYDLPEADDATVYLKPADADDGERAISVTRSEFDAEFEEYDENAKTDAYLRERARNGHGIQ
jgi:hypothetical protein